MACTFEYRAPEALLFDKHYGREIDIWALGVVFYYILTGKFLYNTSDNIDAIEEIFKIFGTPINTDWIIPYSYEAIKNLRNRNRNEAYINKVFGEYPYILSCFTYDPKLRPSTSQLLEMI
jgi:serine/threonine protein kinase